MQEVFSQKKYIIKIPQRGFLAKYIEVFVWAYIVKIGGVKYED